MAASRIISRRPTPFPRAAWVTKRSSRYTPGRPSQVENLGWNEAKPAGSPSRKASSASNPASRWGQACRRITRGRRNRSSALGKLFVQVGLRVRILLPPAESRVRIRLVVLDPSEARGLLDRAQYWLTRVNQSLRPLSLRWRQCNGRMRGFIWSARVTVRDGPKCASE